MIPKNRWKIGIVFLFVLIMFIPTAQAQQPFDITDYWYATVTPLSADPELTIFHSDVKGVVHDNLESKTFDRMTSHCLRLGRISAGKMSWTTYSKFTDPDGDFFIMEGSAEGVLASAQESSFKFLFGTGKWKGISGGGKSKFIFMTRGKQQINPTTVQGFLRMTGTFELPKK
ncbi:MAG: hypothetical protein HXY44_17425 [Syntrophaceae bacterium]|nr:hypothetical protein [Syntrophaceae bacterium]